MNKKVDLFSFWTQGLGTFGGGFSAAKITPRVQTKPNNNPPTPRIPPARPVGRGYERGTNGMIRKVSVAE